MKLTIAIPTRSRAVYLRDTLRTVRAAIDLCKIEVEVVVSDNASDDDTPEVCRTSGIYGLKYVRQPVRLSMRHNFEAALQASTGSHVVFIGDDDAVALHGLQRLSEMITIGGHEILKWRVVNYIWPDPVRSRLGSVTLRTNKLTGRVRRIDPEALLANFTSGRIGTYQSGAMIYHGCISRELIDRVRSVQGGTYFWTTCPDVYASVANLLHTRTQILAADIPITIGGASPRSNGTSGKEYAQTAHAIENSEYARFLAELQGDRFLGRTPSTCPSINLVTIDALQLSHSMAGLTLVLDEAIWARRVSTEISGLAPAVARDAKIQARVLLGPAAELIASPEIQQDQAYSATPPRSSVSVSLAKIRLTGGAAMNGIFPAAQMIDRLCAAETPLARLPRTALGMAAGAAGLIWRALALKRAGL